MSRIIADSIAGEVPGRVITLLRAFQVLWKKLELLGPEMGQGMSEVLEC